LADKLASEKPSAEAAAIGIREVNTTGLPFANLSKLLRKAAALSGKSRTLSAELQQRIVHLAQTAGDPYRGQKLFRSATLGCMQCHAIAGAGGTVAPDLAAIGSSAQPDFLVEHLVLPTKSVKDGFVSLAVVTRDGDAYSGVRVRENAHDLVLKDATHDEIVIRQSSIKRVRDIGTLMPTGLTDALSDNEFADLVRFLMELGKPGPFAVGQAPVQRQWRALADLPEYLALLDAQSCGKALENDPHLAWVKAFSDVAGDLPLDDVRTGPNRQVAVVRSQLSVTGAGRLVIAVNDVQGVRTWIDGQPIPVKEKLSFDVSTGRHSIDFWIDRTVRKATTLRCELVDAQSAAKAQWSAAQP
jgi:putative heme-binding domain-containing protein